jgi:HEAT repeat protein
MGMKSAVFASFLIGILLISNLGCASNGALYNPLSYWDQAETEEYAKYGPSPVQKRETLQALAAQASQLEPAEKERVSQKLAQQVTNETDVLLRIEVAKALGKFDTQTAYAGLKSALHDPDPDVKIAAIRSMANPNNKEAIAELGDLINRETDLDVRVAATQGLGNYNTPSSKQALVAALDDRNPALRYAGVQSLRGMSDIDYKGDTQAWRQFALGETRLPQKPVS